MVPPPFETYFAAMTEGGATLLGLLFVAMSIRRPSSYGEQETAAEVVLADGSLMALAGGFAVSASALVPGVNVGFVVLPSGLLAVFWVTAVGVRLVRAAWTGSAADRARALIPALVAMAGAVSLVVVGACLWRNAEDTVALRGLAFIVLAFYGIALLRSWLFVGGARQGLRAALAPLRR
jgi:hypothetical protein